MIKAGKYNRRVRYQQLTKGEPDALGAPARSWDTVATLWASVRPASGAEKLHAQQVQAVVTHVIELRHPGFTPSPTGRFLYGSPRFNPGDPRVFNVQSVVNVDEGNRELRVYATEPVAPRGSP